MRKKKKEIEKNLNPRLLLKEISLKVYPNFSIVG